MGAWDSISDTELSWADASEAWREACGEFFLASSPGLATLGEYLEAMTRAFRLEATATIGEPVDPSLGFVARTEGGVVGPAGPVDERAVEPMRRYFQEVAAAYRSPDGVPRRAPFLSEVLFDLEHGTRCFFAGRPWLDERATTATLSLETTRATDARRPEVRWGEDPPRAEQDRWTATPADPDEIEDHPKGPLTIEKLLPEREGGKLKVNELVTLATQAPSREIRALAVSNLRWALMRSDGADLPSGELLGAFERVLVEADAVVRADLAEGVTEALTLCDFDLASWRGLLGRLATDPEPLVRAHFAAGCRDAGEALLPEEDALVDLLERDRHPLVVAAFTLNAFDLWSLAWHPCWGVRYLVATRRHLDDPGLYRSELGAATITALASQGPRLRGIVAGLEGLPEGAARQLLVDPEVAVRERLAGRRAWAGLEFLPEALAEDPERSVRRTLAENEHAPVESLERLSTRLETEFPAKKTLAKVRRVPGPTVAEFRDWMARCKASLA